MGRTKPVRRKFTKNYKKTFRVGKVSLGFVTLVMFFVATLLFLSQSNKIAVKGYEISDLDQKVSELKENNEKLKLEAAKLQSISAAEEKIDKSGMVPINQINYVSERTDVALK